MLHAFCEDIVYISGEFIYLFVFHDTDSEESTDPCLVVSALCISLIYFLMFSSRFNIFCENTV